MGTPGAWIAATAANDDRRFGGGLSRRPRSRPRRAHREAASWVEREARERLVRGRELARRRGPALGRDELLLHGLPQQRRGDQALRQHEIVEAPAIEPRAQRALGLGADLEQ